jgi:hypothetical protein
MQDWNIEKRSKGTVVRRKYRVTIKDCLGKCDYVEHYAKSRRDAIAIARAGVWKAGHTGQDGKVTFSAREIEEFEADLKARAEGVEW